MSQSYLNDVKPEFDKNTLIQQVRFILPNLPIIQSQFEQFRLETQSDQILQTLLYYTINSFQKKIKYRKSYLLIIPNVVKSSTMKKFFSIIVATILRSEIKSIIH